MRILVATDQWFPDFRGGSARVATETARRLAKRGHEVVVLAPVSEAAPSLQVDDSLTVHRVLPRGRLPITLTDCVSTWRRARSLDGRFDVAVAHQSTTGCGLVSGRPDCPLAEVVHASAVRELRFDRGQERALRRLPSLALQPFLQWTERRAWRGARRLLVLSEFTRSLIAADRPAEVGRVVNVSGGVDTDAFSPLTDRDAVRNRLGIDDRQQLLFTARRLTPRMGLENLLQAHARIGNGSTLAIAGTGPLEPGLRHLATTLDTASNVRFLGRVSDRELVEWYTAADLFVLPTVAYEGFGMATAEALAVGLPVVGTPVGATPELLLPLGSDFVSSGVGVSSLVEAIRAVLDRTSAELRRRCREYAVERLSWDVVLPRWEAALQDMLEPATVPYGNAVTPEQIGSRGLA
jgi:glycosyltransferase involved in cell wall biosynthesis